MSEPRLYFCAALAGLRGVCRTQCAQVLELDPDAHAGALLRAAPHRVQPGLRIRAAFLRREKKRADDLILLLDRLGPLDHGPDLWGDLDVQHLAARGRRIRRFEPDCRGADPCFKERVHVDRALPHEVRHVDDALKHRP
ncbi:hypothetical protein [Paraburkholderia caballeronis]|uniref:hypothetical protein n=1 Tax=Paraburkholderia caballeronis TaxID=416943 RepID=UPI00141703F9|nr:hypothetical protein [Paraburkholderia caballeronis]